MVNEVNVATSSNFFLGQLTGAKTSDVTTCEGVGLASVIDVMNTVFDLAEQAEQKVPEYFPGVAQPPYSFRTVYGVFTLKPESN